MKNIRRKLYSQNFFHNRKLVQKLVGSSSIQRSDLVLEIGPGQGIITEQLVNIAGYVIGVEIDSYWVKTLKQQFNNTDNLTIHHQNFLQFNLPKLPYKVFANIPFAIEGKIIRKLINSDNSPNDCYLVIMDKLAQRLCARHKPNFFSILHQPWFNFSIIHHFEPTDFRPIPNVNPVFFRFQKRPTPLLPWDQRESYNHFIRQAFKNGLPIHQNLKPHYPNITQILHHLSISQKSKPSHLTLNQYLGLFKYLKP